jgi:hypothetical protein
MAFDILAALRYPFQKSNWLNAWILPALGILLFQSFAFASNWALNTYPSSIPPELLGYGLILPLIILATVFFFGFFWVISHTLQTQGVNAPLPSWLQKLPGYFVAGLKVLPYTILVNILIQYLFQIPLPPLPLDATAEMNTAYSITLGILTLALGLPLFSWPMVRSAKTLSIIALFNPLSWFKSEEKTLSQNTLGGFLSGFLFLAVLFIYMVPMYFLAPLAWSQFVMPFLYIPCLVTGWHLITQGIASTIPTEQVDPVEIEPPVGLPKAMT